MKKIYFIIIPVLLLCIFAIIWPYFFVNIKIFGDKNFILDYGEKYSEPGYRAKYNGKDISKLVKVNDNIKDNFGIYYVTYKYKPKYSLIDVTVKRKVEVKDISAPKLELIGGDDIEITINSEYKELGYTAIDNYDGDVSSSVIVDGKIDTNTLGTYNLTYSVKDSSGNKTEKVRKVLVEKIRPTQMSLTEYTLDGWYDDVKLKETSNKGDSYFNSIKIIGDSNVFHMYQDGLINKGNAWAIPCLHVESMFNTKVNIYGTSETILVLDAINKYKPSIILLNLGLFSTNWITKDVFLKNANNLLDKIKEISPDTKIILNSFYPIRKDNSPNNFKQDIVNEYNFYILELAYKHNLKFLDVQSVLKGNDGYVKPEYIRSDGYHLSTTGYKIVREYIKTHALEG